MNNIKKKILILSGGGIKGIAHIGALCALQEHNILDEIDTIIGTSVGAIIGLLFLIGYSAKELYKIIQILEFKKLIHFNLHNILNNYGIDDGEKIINVITKLLEKKKIDSNINLKDLHDLTKKKIIITVTSVNDKKAIYMSYENYPNINILQCIRMSFSIPFFFIPVLYENKYYIDGGCMDNMPIQLYDNDDDTVIGIYIDENEISQDNIITNILSYLSKIYQCYSKCMKNFICKHNHNNIIILDVNNVSMINFDIDNLELKKNIHDIGYNTTIDFIKNKFNKNNQV
jgi:NTE family protein